MQAETRRVCDMLTTWPFVLTLATLIVNDGTGKLSDFAGIRKGER